MSSNKPDSIGTSADPLGGPRSQLGKWLAIALAVIVVGAAAFYAWGYFAAKGAVDEVKHALDSSSVKTATGGAAQPSTAANADLTRAQRDSLNPDQYLTLSEEVRAHDQAESFNQYLVTAWESIQKTGNLTDEEKRVLYMPDLNKTRSEWTDQDYANYLTLALWLVTTQSTIDEGLRGLSVVINKDEMPESWGTANQWIKEHPGFGLKSINAVQSSPRFNPLTNKELRNTSVGSVKLDDAGGRLVMQTCISVDDRPSSISLYKNYTDSSGNTITILEGSYDNFYNPAIRKLLE